MNRCQCNHLDCVDNMEVYRRHLHHSNAQIPLCDALIAWAMGIMCRNHCNCNQIKYTIYCIANDWHRDMLLRSILAQIKIKMEKPAANRNDISTMSVDLADNRLTRNAVFSVDAMLVDGDNEKLCRTHCMLKTRLFQQNGRERKIREWNRINFAYEWE